jgi:ABC-type bacteriocin/lantibiotic exporter with double-glycine peptidase domain
MHPKKEIFLKNITFKYKKSKNIIDRLNSKIKIGDNVGLFGLSGSGKTTLLDLISGLNLPTKGNIFLDGKKINSKNILYWRSCIDYIQQEIFIKEGSFAENIAFGLPKNKIDYDKVLKCAKIACIHDFIVNFKRGYNEKVGERGNRISGGQNQRIGIARALYKDPDILILDEATNALDSKTEKKVIKSLCKHMINKTMIIVSHKFELLEHCDNIIYLENGKIKSDGQYKRIKSLIKIN